MKTPTQLKNIVKEKYGEIAQSNGCCSTSCCGVEETAASDFTIFAEDYTKLKGYNPDADLKLGCGVPTEYAKISVGNTVVDLGSGAGNDAFVARALVGDSGKVIGVDMTEPMIEKARKNAAKLNFENVEFRFGEIEAMPIDNNTADVVISNCVLNLVPNKAQAFREIYRILKPGGHFSISDVVLNRELPAGLQKAAEMYAGCVSGASLKDDYLKIIAQQGFQDVQVQIEKPLMIPDDVLGKYLSASEIKTLKSAKDAISSVTVFARKGLQ